MSEEVETVEKAPLQKPKAWFGCRHEQVLLMTSGFVLFYTLRYSTSVALVAMTDSKTTTQSDSERTVFNWDSSTRSIVLSSFFWGYLVFQVPGSILTQRLGAHKMFAFAGGSSALFTCAIPMAAKYTSWYGVCFCRAATGLGQAIVVPLLTTLLSKWVPGPERATLTSFVFSGSLIGSILAYSISGKIAVSRYGWQGSYYIWGGVMGLWTVIWMIYGKESPEDHPTIPLDEKKYIDLGLESTGTIQTDSIPWKSVILSKPCWAIWIAMSCRLWGTVLLMTNIPSYLRYIHDFDMENNGYVSSLPYLSAWIFNIPINYLADYSVRVKLISLKTSWVILNTSGEFISALLFIGLGYVDGNQSFLAVTLLALITTMNVATYGCHSSNIIELSPTFAGFIMGIGNTVGQLFSVAVPLAVGVLVPQPDDYTQWRRIFFLTAATYILGTVVYIAFVSVKLQSWEKASNQKAAELDLLNSPRT